MLDCLLHGQPLGRGLLTRNNDIGVVPAPQAVVRHREQRIGVRRQIDADDLGLLVDHMVDETRVLVAEAVMVLPPDVTGEEIVQGRDRPSPFYVIAHLQPLGVLVEHRIDNVDERLVAGEKAVAAGQQIAFEPALALVLAEHLHDSPVRGQVVVIWLRLRVPGAIGDLQDVLPPVRIVLVRAEQPEIVRLHVHLHHVAKEIAHHAGGLCGDRSRRGHLDRIVTKIRQPKIPEHQTTVGVRVGAHATAATRCEFGELRTEPATLVKQLPGPVAHHPVFEDAHMGGIVVHLSHGHLMRAPVAFGALAVDFLGARPSLGRAEHDHWPARPSGEPVPARVSLDALDLSEDGVQSARHELVHLVGLIALHEIRRITIAAKQVL